MTENLAVPKSEEEAAANREKLVVSKTAWKKAAVHTGVVLPSGAVVTIKVPNLAALIEAGEIPNELVDVATAVESVGAEKAPDDALEKLSKLQRHLLSMTVVEPKITPDEVNDLPAEDVPFLTEIAFRQRDIDAVGNAISGIDRLAKYATFREESPSHEVALDA